MSDETPGAPVALSYDPLPTPATGEQQLAVFLTERLAPELERLRAAHLHAVHKGDLYDLGRRAGALRIEVSQQLAEAQRALSVAVADELAIAHRANRSDKLEGQSRPADVVKAAAKSRVAALQKTVDLLRYAREDLASTLSFVQSAMRAMRDEELGELD
jgi:hypothetical protein